MRVRSFPCLVLALLLGDLRPAAAESEGLPKAAGIGRTVVVTNLPGGDEGGKAVKRLAEHRGAKVLRFKEDDIDTVRTALAREGAEYVVLAVSPTTVDMNFHLEVLELCRNLDADPMPDFSFGYLAARDGKDLSLFVDRILAREADVAAESKASVVAATPPGDHLKGLDFMLHFGHGQPWGVDGGLAAEQVNALALTRGPVVFSGACFNGVLSRSYHPSAYQMIYLKPMEVAPERLISLSWVHAGVTGYVAALEADRGEMAMAEWEHLRKCACPLGDVIAHQYRLAFTSLPDDFEGFPRYVPGAKKRMGFYDVMLRGMISRILISDPAYRPLREALDEPVARTEATHDAAAKTLTITVEVTRWSQGSFQNYLPKPPSDRFDHRVTERVALPPSVAGKLGAPTLRAVFEGKEVAVTATHVKQEMWGGTRYVNVQAESSDGALVTKGAVLTWVFPTR